MWKEYFVYDISKTLAGGAGTAFETASIRIDSDSPFEFNKTTYVATNDRIKLKYKDESVGRYLTKGSIDIKAIAGRNILPIGLSNSFLPHIWPKPYIVSAAAVFTVEAADYSAVANTMRLSFHGSKSREGNAPWDYKFRAKQPFIYSFSNGAVTVAANSTATTTIEIDTDAHFLVEKIVGIRTSDALVTINESSRGLDWMNQAVHIDNVVGNAPFPNILPAPRFVRRGSVIVFNLQDLSGNSNVIDINLIGIKLYE